MAVDVQNVNLRVIEKDDTESTEYRIMITGVNNEMVGEVL